MRIHFDEAHRLFHLRTSEMSYAFGIAADGRLRHLYWGPSLSNDDSLLPLAETMLTAYEPSKGVDARKDGVAELPTMEPRPAPKAGATGEVPKGRKEVGGAWRETPRTAGGKRANPMKPRAARQPEICEPPS